MNKKSIILLLALLLPFTIEAAPNDAGPHEWHHGDKIERLTKELGLSGDQKTQLEALFKEKHEKVKSIHTEMEKQMEGILTKEQMTKWTDIKAQHKERWQKHRQGDNDSQPSIQP